MLQQRSQILSPNATLNTSMDSISQAHLTKNYGGSFSQRYTKLKGRELYMQQLGALFLKRFHHYRRNLRILTTNILLPCLFVAMSMTFTKIRPTLTDQPVLELSPSIYEPHNIFYTFDKTNNSHMQSIARDFSNAFSSVCAKKQAENFYTPGSFTSPQPLNSYLCSLVSLEVYTLFLTVVEYNFFSQQKS